MIDKDHSSIARSTTLRLYGDGEVDVDQLHMKLCVVGDEQVGKTTMALAMGCDGDPTKKTAGVKLKFTKSTNQNSEVPC